MLLQFTVSTLIIIMLYRYTKSNETDSEITDIWYDVERDDDYDYDNKLFFNYEFSFPKDDFDHSFS